MKSLEELKFLPISTSQEDLRIRINLIFELIEKKGEGSNVEFAQAFSDVIGFQSYAGAIPTECEFKVLDWIDETYDEDNNGYIDAVASLYAMMSSDRAFNELKKRLSSTKSNFSRQALQGVLNEFEPNT